MLNSYYTLRALAIEWDRSISGHVVDSIWTQAPGELCIGLEGGTSSCTLTFQSHAPIIGAFLKRGIGRARRKQRSLFRELSGQKILRIQVVEGERILVFETTGGMRLHAYLFGPRANIFLTDVADLPTAHFRTRFPLALPPRRPAQMPDSEEAFLAAWAAHPNKPAVTTLTRIVPFFGRTLARESLIEAGIDYSAASDISDLDRTRIFDAAIALHEKLLSPQPCLYEAPLALSLIPLHSRPDQPVKAFNAVDDAVRSFAQLALARRAFSLAYSPKHKALVAKLARAHRTLERLRQQKTTSSKESLFRRYGDLLMAAPAQAAGAQSIELPDLYADGTPVAIPLNPALNSLQNAKRYYDKARNTHQARIHLETLLSAEEAKVAHLTQRFEMLQSVGTMKELKAFEQESEKSSDVLTAKKGPFRRYALAPGFELWVGRNAKESELLTLRHARPFDLWMHARGVSGAHAILRMPGRDARPAGVLLERAAAIAAWHSKARGSAVAPVIVTPRKYVRKARKGGTGEVVVMREEEVLMVEPALP